MKIEQKIWDGTGKWAPNAALGETDTQSQLVFVFGGRELIAAESPLKQIRDMYPSAQIIGCSTAGEICGTRVSDCTLTLTAVRFEKTGIRAVETTLASATDSEAAGRAIAKQLLADDLVHVFVLSEGLKVNGSKLVAGLTAGLPASVAVTGGLSGDGANFQQTLVHLNGSTGEGKIAAVGFYGTKLRVGYGSLGGWDSFGPERRVTRSSGNVLFELDGESALSLYKRYLGTHASGLPASGLRFPLSLRSGPTDTAVVRTILAIDENEQSLTFAGDVPEGMYARLMRANIDRLVDGATGAASTSNLAFEKNSAELAILISCVGRKLVLQQRTEEEVEGVRAVLGDRAAMTGFYSYGEISPFTPNARCELHNQTMTITVFAEAA